MFKNNCCGWMFFNKCTSIFCYGWMFLTMFKSNKLRHNDYFKISTDLIFNPQIIAVEMHFRLQMLQLTSWCVNRWDLSEYSLYWSSPHSLQGTGLTWWTCLWCFFNLVRLENVLAQFGQLSTCLSCIVKLWRKLNLEQKLQLSKAKLPIMWWKSLFVNLIETAYNRMLMSWTLNIWHSAACYLSCTSNYFHTTAC